MHVHAVTRVHAVTPKLVIPESEPEQILLLIEYVHNHIMLCEETHFSIIWELYIFVIKLNLVKKVKISQTNLESGNGSDVTFYVLSYNSTYD